MYLSELIVTMIYIFWSVALQQMVRELLSTYKNICQYWRTVVTENSFEDLTKSASKIMVIM